MYDNYNYPAGADTPDAPWNEHEPQNKKFNIFVEYSLVKELVVETNDYCYEMYGDDDGEYPVPDTSGTNWERAYKNDNHFTVVEMLNELKCYIEQDLQNTHISSSKHSYLVRMLADCQGWKEEIVDIGEQ